MGENGAGKSTLVKIMTGLHLPDKGAIRVNRHNVLFRSTSPAQHAGVSVIYQEPAMFRDLSVAENVFMHRQPARPRSGFRVPKKSVQARLTKLACSYLAAASMLSLL
jgi:rhamnose transport system ATP-binding protein